MAKYNIFVDNHEQEDEACYWFSDFLDATASLDLGYEKRK